MALLCTKGVVDILTVEWWTCIGIDESLTTSQCAQRNAHKFLLPTLSPSSIVWYERWLRGKRNIMHGTVYMSVVLLSDQVCASECSL